jgi:unsaturated chondroitin disaccharide hydrolase
MRRSAMQTLIFFAFSAPAASAATLDVTADLNFIEAQAQKTVASFRPGDFPFAGGQMGTWTTVGASDWTSGFFPGELWLLYQATGSAQWLTDAKNWTAPLASQATETDRHDVGFIIGESFGNGYRLTGDPTYKSEILTAAASLATRYNPTVGAIKSWSFSPWQNQFPVIIDNMMTLGPLQWGATHGGDPSWAVDAATHAQTTIEYLVRGDGSTYQLVNFNPTTGARAVPEYYQTGGLSATSVWSRGQAWGLYGFVQAYEATGNPAFLATAEDLAAYFFRHLPSDYVPYYDFDAPVTPMPRRDTSAAAIAADGLVMLSTVAKTPAERATYLTEAEDILGSLSSSYLAPASGEAVLIDGSVSVPTDYEADTALIYGDYFFTEALLRLQNELEGKPGWTLYSWNPAIPELSTWAMCSSVSRALHALPIARRSAYHRRHNPVGRFIDHMSEASAVEISVIQNSKSPGDGRAGPPTLSETR